jgi:hypothetical protein
MKNSRDYTNRSHPVLSRKTREKYDKKPLFSGYCASGKKFSTGSLHFAGEDPVKKS